MAKVSENIFNIDLDLLAPVSDLHSWNMERWTGTHFIIYFEHFDVNS